MRIVVDIGQLPFHKHSPVVLAPTPQLPEAKLAQEIGITTHPLAVLFALQVFKV
jgi:hypothetical protein